MPPQDPNNPNQNTVPPQAGYGPPQPQQPNYPPQPGPPQQPQMPQPQVFGQPQAPGQAPPGPINSYPQNNPAEPQQPQYPNQPQPMQQGYATNMGYPQGYPPPVAPKSGVKKIAIIAAVLIGVVGIGILTVLGSKKLITPSVALENYQNAEFGFEVQAPQGWEPKVTNEEFSKEVSFLEPVGDVKDESEASRYYASVSVKYQLSDKEFLQQEEAEYFENIKKALKSSINDQAESKTSEKASIEQEEMTSLNGHKAYKIKVKLTNFDYKESSIGYETALIVYVDKTKAYSITVRGHESEALLAKTDSILESFKTK